MADKAELTLLAGCLFTIRASSARTVSASPPAGFDRVLVVLCPSELGNESGNLGT